MVIYLSIFLYIYLFGFFGKKSALRINNNENKNQTTKHFAFLLWLVPVFFIGLRTNFIDTKAYIEGFNSLTLDYNLFFADFFERDNFGWNLYEFIIKKFITENANAFLMITAILQAYALGRLYYKYSIDYSFSVLLFFLSTSFTYMMNGIRQFFAACLIAYFFNFITEKKYFRFILVVLLASTIHASAIIWVLMVFIVQGKALNKKTILFAVITAVVILFLDRFTSVLEFMLLGTEYEGYTNQFKYDDGSSIFHTVIAVVPILIAMLRLEKIRKSDNVLLNVLVNISVVAFLVSLIANFTSGILVGRLPVYFNIFTYILLPLEFKFVFDEDSERLMRYFCIIGYLLFALYYMKTYAYSGMPYISDILGINTWS